MFKRLLRIIATYGLVILALGAVSSKAETINGVGFGDSLMAGYQLANGDGFTDQLQKTLVELGYDVTIANAGVSGDTSSGGLARLDWSVPDTTDFVILELGANDALRGILPDITRANLKKMIEGLQSRDIDVILVGIVAPPNMGEDYASKFNPIYADLSAKYDVPFYPFFLDGAIGNPELMLDDTIHPNPDGVKVMVERFLPTIRAYLNAR